MASDQFESGTHRGDASWEAQSAVARIVVENWRANGRGTPTEEIVRQAIGEGIPEDDAVAAVEDLRKRGWAYQIRPGLLCPVRELEVDRLG